MTERHPKTILIVDDEDTIHRALARTLRKERYDLLHAYDAAEAWAILGQHPAIDLIVCDHYMPGTRGLDLLMEIRHRYPRVVTILLTAQADLQLVINSINRGNVHRFFTKPWDGDQLRAEIRDLLGVAPAAERENELEAAETRLRAELAPGQDENGAWVIDVPE